MKDCDNFVCLGSDFTEDKNGEITCAGEKCKRDECRAFNTCELCENQNTCPTYNN